MKKLLSILVIGVVAMALPMSASALRLEHESSKSCMNDDGKCEQTIKLFIADNDTPDGLSSVTPTFTLTGDADKVDVKVESANENIIVESSREGDVVTMQFVALAPITDETFQLGTITLELESSAVNCEGKLALNGVEYPVTDEDPTEPPKTGAALPLTILACGIGAGAVIYIVTKKNKKLYKI